MAPANFSEVSTSTRDDLSVQYGTSTYLGKKVSSQLVGDLVRLTWAWNGRTQKEGSVSRSWTLKGRREFCMEATVRKLGYCQVGYNESWSGKEIMTIGERLALVKNPQNLSWRMFKPQCLRCRHHKGSEVKWPEKHQRTEVLQSSQLFLMLFSFWPLPQHCWDISLESCDTVTVDSHGALGLPSSFHQPLMSAHWQAFLEVQGGYRRRVGTVFKRLTY